MTQPFANPFTAQPPAVPTATPMAPPAAVASPFPPSAPVYPPAGMPAPPAVSDPFGAPAPPVPRAPRMQDLYDFTTGHGRLLLLAPYRIETVPNRLSPIPGATQERITFDLAVLDGGPIHYGGKPEGRPPTPHTKVAEVPAYFEAVYNSNTGIVTACREALANRIAGTGPSMVLGRLFIGSTAREGQSPPWLIGRPDLPRERQIEGPTPEEAELARAFLRSELGAKMLTPGRR